MKDIHKSPNSDSSELRTYNANDVETIILNFTKQHYDSNVCRDKINNYLVDKSLIYKKVKYTYNYYYQNVRVRLHIAGQAARIIKKEFGLISSNTCYTYWSYKYGRYIISIKYIDGNGRYHIGHSNYDGKFNFETDSFKEFFLKIKSL